MVEMGVSTRSCGENHDFFCDLVIPIAYGAPH